MACVEDEGLCFRVAFRVTRCRRGLLSSPSSFPFSPNTTPPSPSSSLPFFSSPPSSYAKALDAIRKSRLEYSSKAKEVKADLAGYSAHLQAAEGLESDLSSAQSSLASIEEKNASYESRIAEKKTEGSKLSSKLADLEEMRDSEAEHTSDLQSARGIAESQRGMLEKVLDAEKSEGDLETMLEEFDAAVDDNQGGFQKMLDDYEKLKASLENLQNDRIAKCSHRGSLTAANEANEMLLVQRNSLIDLVMSEHKLRFPAGVTEASDLSSAQFSQVMSILEAQKTEIENAVKAAKREFTTEDDKAQLAIGELRAKQKNIESSRSSNAVTRTSLEARLSAISATISSQSRISTSEVDDAVRQAKQLVEERDKASENARLNEIPRDIKKDESNIHDLELKIEEASEGLVQLRACADDENACAMLEKQAEQEASRLVESCKDLLERFPNFSIELEGVCAAELQSLERASQNVSSKLSAKRSAQEALGAAVGEKQRQLTEATTLADWYRSSRDGLKTSVAAGRASRDVVNGIAKDVVRHDKDEMGVSCRVSESSRHLLLLL